MERADLVAALDAAAKLTKRDQFIFLRADRAVAYGDLMDVMECCARVAIRGSDSVALEGRRRRRGARGGVKMPSPDGAGSRTHVER